MCYVWYKYFWLQLVTATNMQNWRDKKIAMSKRAINFIVFIDDENEFYLKILLGIKNSWERPML